jgi:exodeoxyribonuclease VII small subunit
MTRKTRETTDPPEPSFEAALERLEAIVERIETDELELDASLALFEEGVRLLRAAERVLAGAETRVQQLVGDGDEFRMTPFDEDR